MLLHFKVHHTHAEQPGGCSPTWHFLAIYVHHSQTMAVNLGRARPTGTNHTIQNSFHPFRRIAALYRSSLAEYLCLIGNSKLGVLQLFCFGTQKPGVYVSTLFQNINCLTKLKLTRQNTISQLIFTISRPWLQLWNKPGRLLLAALSRTQWVTPNVIFHSEDIGSIQKGYPIFG